MIEKLIPINNQQSTIDNPKGKTARGQLPFSHLFLIKNSISEKFKEGKL